MQWLKGLFGGEEEEEVWEVNVNKLKAPIGNANNKGPQNLSWANYEHRKQGGAKANKTRRVRKNEEVWEVNVNALEIPVGNANNKSKGKNLSWANYNRRKRNIRVLVPNENYVYSQPKTRKSRKSRKAQSKVSKRK